MNARLKALGGLAGAAAALAGVAMVGGQAASGWDLSWNAITGGGGRSTAPGYELRGAVLPAAGTSTGGGFGVQGGFFAGDAVKYLGFTPSVSRDGVN